MSAATLERIAGGTALDEQRLAVVRIEGARHSLIWAHDPERTLSVLLDRPDQGDEKLVRPVGAFRPEEGDAAGEAALAAWLGSERLDPAELPRGGAAAL